MSEAPQGAHLLVTPNLDAGGFGPFDPPQHRDIPAPLGSALSGLRARVKAARERRYTDQRIPGLGDPKNPSDPEALFMRFVPLSAAAQAEVMGAPAVDGFAGEWRDAVSLICRGCVGLFSVDSHGEPVGDPATWPRIDSALADSLGVDLSGSTDKYGDLLREIFVADQDVVMMGNVYSRWLVSSSRPTERQSPEA